VGQIIGKSANDEKHLASTQHQHVPIEHVHVIFAFMSRLRRMLISTPSGYLNFLIRLSVRVSS